VFHSLFQRDFTQRKKGKEGRKKVRGEKGARNIEFLPVAKNGRYGERGGSVLTNGQDEYLAIRKNFTGRKKKDWTPKAGKGKFRSKGRKGIPKKQTERGKRRKEGASSRTKGRLLLGTNSESQENREKKKVTIEPKKRIEKFLKKGGEKKKKPRSPHAEEPKEEESRGGDKGVPPETHIDLGRTGEATSAGKKSEVEKGRIARKANHGGKLGKLKEVHKDNTEKGNQESRVLDSRAREVHSSRCRKSSNHLEVEVWMTKEGYDGICRPKDWVHLVFSRQSGDGQ